MRNDSVLHETALTACSHSSGSGKTLTPPTPPYINNTPLHEDSSQPLSNTASPVLPPRLNPSFSTASVSLQEETKDGSPRRRLESGVEFSDPFSTYKGGTVAALLSIGEFSSPRLTPVPVFSLGVEPQTQLPLKTNFNLGLSPKNYFVILLHLILV